MPTASTILMIRPAAFGFNAETAVNNYFQQAPAEDHPALQEKALREFDAMVQCLRDNGVDVLLFEDGKEPAKPDALFPNNWISTSPAGIVSVYPMYAPSRRAEKRDDILQYLGREFQVKDVQDWSEYEADGRFLEGTGSMVIDHDHQMIYSCISERTSLPVLEKYAKANGYQAIVFIATDKTGRPIYHTNVMMTLGSGFCVLCEESIDEEWELIAVRELLEATHHTIIPISRGQMHAFAGNMLELKGKNDERLLVMSMTAFHSLRAEQKEMLQAYARILPVAVPTIEAVEGGSVRCMIAEIFLDKKVN
jgi:hypothetical protein